MHSVLGELPFLQTLQRKLERLQHLKQDFKSGHEPSWVLPVFPWVLFSSTMIIAKYSRFQAECHTNVSSQGLAGCPHTFVKDDFQCSHSTLWQLCIWEPELIFLVEQQIRLSSVLENPPPGRWNSGAVTLGLGKPCITLIVSSPKN